MARERIMKGPGTEGFTPSGPWITIAVGGAAAVLGAILSAVDATVATFCSVSAMVAGLILAGVAVSWRLRSVGQSFEERTEAAGLVAVAGGVALMALVGMHRWDSLQILLGAIAAIALLAAVLILLPSPGRKIVISLLVLFHFGGILTAVTAVEVRGFPGPWLPTQIWYRVYRPYLTFTYLNNAYHFYSPEPGPPTLVWFRVQYEDGSSRWVKLAHRSGFPTRLQYQRMLALTESVNQAEMTSVQKLNELAASREVAYRIGRIQVAPHPEVLINNQYQEPTPLAKEYLSSYVRHVAAHYPHQEQPELAVKRIKVYKLIHHLIQPWQMEEGLSPLDPTLYAIYYFGEYTPDGKLQKPSYVVDEFFEWEEMTPGGRRVFREPARDPLLYWLLPMRRIPADPNKKPTRPSDWKPLDSFTPHAEGSQDVESLIPWPEYSK